MNENMQKTNQGIKDHRHYEFGHLVLDIHPYLQIPFYTIHICALKEKLYFNDSVIIDAPLFFDFIRFNIS
jgi:hypothetical protein